MDRSLASICGMFYAHTCRATCVVVTKSTLVVHMMLVDVYVHTSSASFVSLFSNNIIGTCICIGIERLSSPISNPLFDPIMRYGKGAKCPISDTQCGYWTVSSFMFGPIGAK